MRFETSVQTGPDRVENDLFPGGGRAPAYGCKRRVLLFRKLLLPGSETFILDQYSAYRSWQPILLGYQRVPGLALEDVDTVLVAERLTWIQRMRLKLYQHGQYAGYVPRALRLLVARQRPDIVHAHFAYDAILISDVARRLAVPLVVTLHGDDILRGPTVWRSGSKGQVFRLYPRKLQQLFSDPGVHFIAVSQAVAARAIAQGAAPDRVHVRYTGTRIARTAASDMRGRRREVLFVGRLVEFKGCEYLLRAMVRVHQDVPDARLVVIGDGPLRGDLETLARRLALDVEFLGAVGRDVVRNRMAAARVFCLPSVTDREGVFEAFGMVILEAMASGLAVVTSALGGSEAIRHGETGFVVAERDVAAMADNIVTLLRDDALFERLTQRAQRDVQSRFDLETCTAKIEQLYDTILDTTR